MATHALHDVRLTVHEESSVPRAGLVELLTDLSFVRESSPAPADGQALTLSVRISPGAVRVPRAGRDRFRAHGLRAVELHTDLYISDGSSLLHVQARHGRAEARLAPRFFAQAPLLRQRFWAYGLLELLRPRGLYGLHAAGVAMPSGRRLLIVGPSGSGKSTLTIGLLRKGCRYLSDDAVLLRAVPEGVEALAFRKPFSIDSSAALDYGDLSLGPDRLSPSGKRKRRADVRSAYPARHLERFQPDAILFPTIVPGPHSVLRTVSRSRALGYLLEQSGPELFDVSTMTPHLSVLTRLVRQTTAYELHAGRDLHRSPETLLELIHGSGGAARG